MLTIFRKVRRSLLGSGTTQKYILYALGEILLVVLGILIALQINNWNTGKKDAADEAYILHEILDNLKEDSSQLSYIVERRKIAQAGVDNLMNSLLKSPDNAVDKKDFAQFLTFERYYPLNNAFEMMKSTGLTITNQNLRSMISRYFDFEQKKVSRSIEDIEQVILRIFQSENTLRSNLRKSAVGTKKNVQVDFYNGNDPEFKKVLLEEIITFNDNNTTTLEKVNGFIAINSALIEEITLELQSIRLSKYLNQY